MSLVRRGSLAAAITLALGVSHAQATDFSVSTNADSGPGSLRQALIDAAADSSTPHTISLAAIAGQTIQVSSRLQFLSSVTEMDLTIEGSDVTVASNGNDGVFGFSSGYGGTLVVEINDMTITGGSVGPTPEGGESPAGERGGFGFGSGGGILFDSAPDTGSALALANVTVTDNQANYEGGGLAVYGASLIIADSTISNNSGGTGGGVFHEGYSLSVTGSTISGNTAQSGGPIFPDSERLLMRRAESRGKFPIFGGDAGGIRSYSEEGASIIDSVISDNSAGGSFGGADILSESGDIVIERTTVSGNTAERFVGGLLAGSYTGSISILSSTISGNSGGQIVGGAFALSYYSGAVLIENSTVSGNSVASGAGGLVGLTSGNPLRVDFSTIVDNSADSGVGGAALYMYSYVGSGAGLGFADPSVNASIIAGNLAAGAASDLDTDLPIAPAAMPGLHALAGADEGNSQPMGGGLNIDVNYSLLGVSNPRLTLDSISQGLLGQDPLLGPLADNGGTTLSHLPGGGSPVLGLVPVGTLGCGTTVAQDQLGEPRGGTASCTLGSLEVRGTPEPAPVAVPVGSPIALMLMAGLMGLAGLFGLRRRKRPV